MDLYKICVGAFHKSMPIFKSTLSSSWCSSRRCTSCNCNPNEFLMTFNLTAWRPTVGQTFEFCSKLWNVGLSYITNVGILNFLSLFSSKISNFSHIQYWYRFLNTFWCFGPLCGRVAPNLSVVCPSPTRLGKPALIYFRSGTTDKTGTCHESKALFIKPLQRLPISSLKA